MCYLRDLLADLAGLFLAADALGRLAAAALGRLEAEAFKPCQRGPDSKGSGICGSARQRQVPGSHDLTDSVSMELGSYEAIKAAVMVGKGVGFVAYRSLGAEIQADLVKVLDIPELDATIQLQLIYLKDKKMTTSQSAFMEIVSPRVTEAVA